MRKTFAIAFITMFVCMQPVYSQITTNELPVSVQRGLVFHAKENGSISLPVLDIKKALYEDSISQGKNGNGKGFTRTSLPIVFAIDSEKDGLLKMVESYGKWRSMQTRLWL